MTKHELSQAYKLARSSAILPGYLSEDLEAFHGYGLPGFQPIHCSIEHVAALIRGQCFCLDGSMDSVEFAELATLGRRLFQIVGASC